MQQNRLDKILDFIRRTGDKAILFDEMGEFVIMSMDDYQKFFTGGAQIEEMTEEELLKKINREIALWRESQTEEDIKIQAEQLNKPYYDSLDDLPQYSDGDWSGGRLSDIEDSGHKDEWGMRDEFERDKDDNCDFDYMGDEFDEFDNEGYEGDSDKDDDDFVDNYLEDVEQKEISEEEKEANINNFGYRNPNDTRDNFGNFSPILVKNNGIEEDYEEEDSKYSHIPPPPDVNGSKAEIPF